MTQPLKCLVSLFFLFSGATAFSQNVIPDTCQIPEFKTTPGFYSSPLAVELTATTPGSLIYFTIDGVDPTEQSTLYSSPVQVTGTLVIRARCFAPGAAPSLIATGSYFINESVTLPVISLTTDPYNLYDPKYGIFVYWEPYYESNLFQDWERPIHVEWFEADGTPGFSQDAGARVHGGLTRAQSQKALNIYARSIYGKSKFDYRLFPGLDLDSYDAFVLRNGGNDFKWTLFRDDMMQSIVSGVMDFEMAASRPAIVFLNGQYYGIMHVREKVSDSFINNHTNVTKSKMDLLEYPPYITEPKVLNGTADAYFGLMDYLNSHDLADDNFYKVVAAQVDIRNVIDYQLSEIYFDNGDWPGNNIKWWRPNNPAGKWRWILFDTDFGFGLSPFGNETGNQLLHYLHNTLMQATQADGGAWPNPPYSTLLFRSLLDNAGFRNRFINTFCDHLNTTFQAQRVNGLINRMKAVLEPEIGRHHEKYPESAGNWPADIQVMTTFANERVNNVFNHLMVKFMLQRTQTLNLTVTDTTLGTIQVNSMVLQTMPFSGRYFPRIPVTLTAIPKPGNRFVSWSDGDTSLFKVVDVAGNTPLITASFESAPAGSELSVMINEINYRSDATFDTKDWVELYNHSDGTVSLGGWTFRDNSDDHSFVFPSQLSLEPWSFLVICRNSTVFKILQPDAKLVVGDLGFKFSSTGDELRLFNGTGDLIDRVSYTSLSPWPDLAGKDGFTLELADPGLDNSLPGNWMISSTFSGTPGKKNSYLMSVDVPEIRNADFRVYPNPSTGTTIIRYATNSGGYVGVEVIDFNGRIISGLIDGIQPSGDYQVTWNGTDGSGSVLPGGIYFCKLTANGRVRFHKILLIR
jgi:hypothetical protein